MRAEYVVPLTGKLQTRLDLLEKDATAAGRQLPPATRNKLNKDIEKLNKKHTELLAYDEKLRYYADLRSITGFRRRRKSKLRQVWGSAGRGEGGDGECK